MVQQRTSSDDDKDVKPKIIEGAYLVSSNNITAINAAAVTSKHNYSLPPQAFHHQPITLIGQSPQSQNKMLMSHTGQGSLAISTPIQELQNKIMPASNIKLSIVPSLIQQQGGGIVIDAKGLNAAGGDHKTAILTTTTSAHRNDSAPR